MANIHGYVAPGFESVRDEFERNFKERGDLGASCCVFVEGEAIVDLWGGIADRATGAPWDEDTMTVIMSATKVAVALSAHILAERGELDFDTPVAEYWPEFAQNGKEDITVRMLLTHQAGLPAVKDTVPEGKVYDWEYMTSALAGTTPFWEPGTGAGYHALTYGWLIGEVVRRVSGLCLGQFIREEITGPLGSDFWLGLPESEFDRVAPLHPNPEEPMRLALEFDPDPNSLFHLAFENTGGHFEPGAWNSCEAWKAEIGAAGGISNARGLARIYAPLATGGTFNGVQLVRPETITRLGSVQAAVNAERTVGMACRYTLGLERIAVDGAFPETAFGHFGWGGSLGYADPDAQVAFGFVANQMESTPRAEALTGAVYRSLGYRQGAYGLWVR